MAQQRSQTGRARPFDHGLFNLQQQHDRVLNIALVDQQHVVNEPAHDGGGQRPRGFDRDTLGQRRAGARHRHALDRGIHGREAVGLHADHFDVGPHRPRRDRHARDQAAAADRHAQALQIGLRRQHFGADRALPGDHVDVIVRVHHRQPARLHQLFGLHARVVERVSREDHFGVKAPRALDLDGRGEARHHDHGRNSHPLRVKGDALSVIAGGHRDHSARAFLRAQRAQPVQRAALLEAGRELQVLEFQPDFGLRDPRQRARVQKRRDFDLAGDPLCGAPDVVGRGPEPRQGLGMRFGEHGVRVYSA